MSINSFSDAGLDLPAVSRRSVDMAVCHLELIARLKVWLKLVALTLGLHQSTPKRTYDTENAA